jgi:hypothetical protein
VERGDVWARLIGAAGAIGAAVTLVYLIGGASLSMRYAGFGLPGNQAATLTPREDLLAAGLRTLAVWALLGVALVLALRALPDGFVRVLGDRLSRPWGLVLAAVVALVLFLVLRVWWPLATYGAVLAILLASRHWGTRPLARLLMSVLAVALVAVAYEADRISYLVEWTCVDVARASAVDAAAGSPVAAGTRQRVCGTLIGQSDRGFYLGLRTRSHPTGKRAMPSRVGFIPAARVQAAYTEKRPARATANHAADRREPLRSRLWDIRVH